MYGTRMTDRPTETTDRPALRPAAYQPASVNAHRPTGTDRPAPADTATVDNQPTPAFDAEPTGDRPTRLRNPFTRPTDRKEATMPTDAPTDRTPTDATDRPHRPTPTTTPTDTTDTESVGRLQTWRNRRATAANTRKAEATDRAEAARRAAANRPASTPAPTGRHTDHADDIAPVPHALKWIGVWLDRTFGAIPLAAPLIVSGYYTMQVFTGQPLNAHPTVAFAATCALEGGLWKLSRLYEKTLVAGDSTMALRAGIGFYIGIIGGLIYWHADHQAKMEGRTELGTDALPAFGVAVMCALGVYIWSRTARWMRRRELYAAGRVDAQAPKFAALAWFLTPLETPKALRHAVKYRIQSPVEAVEDWRLFKSAGKPVVWPPTGRPAPTDPAGPSPTDVPADPTPATAPTVEATDRPAPADQATQHRPTDTPTDPATTRPTGAQVVANRPTVTAPVDRPATPKATTNRLATTADRPAITANIPAPTRPTTPTRPAADNGTDRPAFTPAAVENAATIRAVFGTTDRLKLADVRNHFDPRWSYDKANPAFKAYLAGADLTDRPAEQAQPATVAG
jgi:hypothetical protein